MSDAALDALAKEFFEWILPMHPTLASWVGIHVYDHLLPDGSRKAVDRDIAKEKGALDALAAIDRSSLSLGRRIDYGSLRNAVRLALFQDEELRIWEARPQGGEDLGEALYPLFLRNFAPFPARVESLTGRLERAPAFLEETKDRVTAPTRIWTEIAAETAAQMPAFLDMIEAAVKGAVPSADAARFAEASARTKQALAEHTRWIQGDLLPKARAVVGVGPGKYRKMLRLREFGLTVDEILGIGRRYLRESKRELAALARRVRRGAAVSKANELVKSDHPKDWEGVRAYTAKVMEESRTFLVEKGLCTVPPNEVLHVIETPAFLRHLIPFAAYSGPARFDPVPEGFYMVTPYPDQPEMLREASYAGVRNTAVHEGYPGHHLQLTCANQNPSYARMLCQATETIEGWAHYCEDMMKEQGFTADPATKFVQMQDQIWRACRILVDIGIHMRTMTVDEAVDLLVKEAGMERPGAVAEVKRYTFTPTYPLSYLLGKHLIRKLRADVKRGLGKQYTDRFFHDTYLYAGSIPMKQMAELFARKIKELRRLRTRGL